MARWWLAVISPRVAAVVLLVALACLAYVGGRSNLDLAKVLLSGAFLGGSVVWLWQQGGSREREDEPADGRGDWWVFRDLDRAGWPWKRES